MLRVLSFLFSEELANCFLPHALVSCAKFIPSKCSIVAVQRRNLIPSCRTLAMAWSRSTLRIPRGSSTGSLRPADIVNSAPALPLTRGAGGKGHSRCHPHTQQHNLGPSYVRKKA